MTVALRVPRRGIQVFDVKFHAKIFKGNAIKLRVVVSYDHLRDSKLTHYIFPNEPFDVLVLDACIGFSFYPLAEIIGSNEQKLLLSGYSG